jgi:hypothetical protein
MISFIAGVDRTAAHLIDEAASGCTVRRVIHKALLVLVIVALAAGCSGDENTQTSARPTTGTDAMPTVPQCWRTVAGQYREASDEAVPILRDQVGELLDEYDALARAQAKGDAAAASRAFEDFIDTLRVATEASSRFERLAREARVAREACDSEDPASSAVASCWKDVAGAYERAVSQASLALDKPFAKVLFGVQLFIAAGEDRDADALRRANRVLRGALEGVLPPAARFAQRSGAAKRENDSCEAA